MARPTTLVGGPVLVPGDGVRWSWPCGPATRSAATGVDELMVAGPLVLPARDGCRSRSSVGPAGRRRRARPVTSTPGAVDGTRARWTRHATGLLGTDGRARPLSDPAAWPPVDAEVD